MVNITITVPESVARWARIWAARHNTSVSKLVGEMLSDRMDRDTAYEAAMKRYLGKSPVQLRNSEQSYPRRADLHER